MRSFLSRAWNKVRPQPKPGEVQYPLGLSRDQVDSLNQLLSTPQWRTYTEALQAVCEQDFARILSGLPQDQYQLYCGRIQARLEVLALPDTITSKARELDEHSRPARTEPDPNDLAFYGSPYFRRGTNGKRP